MRSYFASLVLLFILSTGAVTTTRAETVAENNKAANPPLFSESTTTCTAQFKLKPAGIKDHHGFVVVTGPNNAQLEIRGGPSKGGSGDSSVPGSTSSGSGLQPSGNPFNCASSHEWGVVVPYVGKHGRLGTTGSGTVIYSPDGKPEDVKFSVNIGPGAQKNVCALANCMMSMVKTLGASCKIYTAGTGKLRNSNTLISLALSSCGVPDPLPATMSATGWGNGWD
ncbi:hypothetical protein [Microvirga pakistanensis]|uniref:hypothetical protein n=1 Tax=Microvirga pakistanensis TaxID=1682650 RepID=UPI00106C76F4|nr:hypothetical protein [Microvirga pakistanensis]